MREISQEKIELWLKEVFWAGKRSFWSAKEHHAQKSCVDWCFAQTFSAAVKSQWMQTAQVQSRRRSQYEANEGNNRSKCELCTSSCNFACISTWQRWVVNKKTCATKNQWHHFFLRCSGVLPLDAKIFLLAWGRLWAENQQEWQTHKFVGISNEFGRNWEQSNWSVTKETKLAFLLGPSFFACAARPFIASLRAQRNLIEVSRTRCTGTPKIRDCFMALHCTQGTSSTEWIASVPNMQAKTRRVGQCQTTGVDGVLLEDNNSALNY